MWMDAMNREMENLKVIFDVLEYEAKIPVGHRKASGHPVFDSRVTLEHKPRWVKHGVRTSLMSSLQRHSSKRSNGL